MGYPRISKLHKPLLFNHLSGSWLIFMRDSVTLSPAFRTPNPLDTPSTTGVVPVAGCCRRLGRCLLGAVRVASGLSQLLGPRRSDLRRGDAGNARIAQLVGADLRRQAVLR